MYRLYIVEGLPCSGKSTVSEFAAGVLENDHKVIFYDEGSGAHPADYEFHAFLSNEDIKLFSERERREILECSERTVNGWVMSLSDFTGSLFKKLLAFKIYDFLPWEKESPVMLEKWREFKQNADKDAVYVFNCVFLQNPMCETMMRFGFDTDKSFEYIRNIADIVREMEPYVIYLKNDDIAEAVKRTAKERKGWLEAVIDYHVGGAYGKSINADGFDGYIKCLEERQRRELEILSRLEIDSMVIENAHYDWTSAY